MTRWCTARQALSGIAGCLVLAVLTACRSGPTVEAEPLAAAAAPRRVEGRIQVFEVTAYSIEGTTRSGAKTREGIVAADPRVLPLGSRVRILDAGKYSGVYRVEDTGRTIRGLELDIYLRSDAEAKKFGRKRLRVERLEDG